MSGVSVSPPDRVRLSMPGMNNSSQDPDYVGPVGHEKKFHKTHFGVLRTLRKRTHPKDDPDWVYVGAGRWKRISQKRDNAGEEPEVTNDISSE